MPKLGTVTLDGTKVRANSRHSVMSCEHACMLEAQLQAEVEELTARTKAAKRTGRKLCGRPQQPPSPGPAHGTRAI